MKTFLPFSKAFFPLVVLFMMCATASAQNGHVTESDNASISLLDFSVGFENAYASVKWSAKMEKSFGYFIIEQSVDGKEYQDHAVFFGAESPVGTENFTFKDRHINASSDTFYYRLKMVDTSGKITYSQVQIIRRKQENNRVS